MKELKAYEIPFSGLKEGTHDYSFEIDGKFFECFEYSEVKQGKINVRLSLEKQSRMMIFNFHIKGVVIVQCDRCLEDMEYPVEGNERLIVKFGQEWKEETEEILIIPEKENMINIAEFIYEYIVLLLPYQKVHPEGTEGCNPEMVKKLSEHSQHDEDPRWEALKALKEKFD